MLQVWALQGPHWKVFTIFDQSDITVTKDLFLTKPLLTESSYLMFERLLCRVRTWSVAIFIYYKRRLLSVFGLVVWTWLIMRSSKWVNKVGRCRSQYFGMWLISKIKCLDLSLHVSGLILICLLFFRSVNTDESKHWFLAPYMQKRDTTLKHF